MSIEVVILLYLAAIVILVLEIFVPSGGALAVIGAIALLASIYYGFQHSLIIGTGQVIVSIIVIPLMIYIGIKKMTLKKNLESGQGFTAEKVEFSKLIGKEGTAYTNLRPSGAAVIDGKKIDVVTEGEMVDKNTPVKVIKAEGNRIIVKSVKR